MVELLVAEKQLVRNIHKSLCNVLEVLWSTKAQLVAG
jgi:hypothetical protein